MAMVVREKKRQMAKEVLFIAIVESIPVFCLTLVVFCVFKWNKENYYIKWGFIRKC